MAGWIKLHRQILNWEWYADINVTRLFFHLLLIANHDDGHWKGEIIKRGQKITSINKLSLETGLSEQQVRTSLKKLQKTNEITCTSTSKYTVVNVVNYSVYQSSAESEQQANEQTDNKQITNNQQTNNKQITTNKNEKNDKNKKNDKKSTYAEFVTMKEEEYQKLIENYGEEATKGMVTILDNYKGANNKKYASDYRAILNWVIEKYNQKHPQDKPKINFDDVLKGIDFDE